MNQYPQYLLFVVTPHDGPKGFRDFVQKDEDITWLTTLAANSGPVDWYVTDEDGIVVESNVLTKGTNLNF